MSYTYRSEGTADQRAEQRRRKLYRGILAYGRAMAGIAARITALGSQMDQKIAQAIWDDVDVGTVASAAGITYTKPRSIGLAFEYLPDSGSTAASHVKTLRALTQQAGWLHAEQQELRRRQDQLIVTAPGCSTLPGRQPSRA